GRGRPPDRGGRRQAAQDDGLGQALLTTVVRLGVSDDFPAPRADVCIGLLGWWWARRAVYDCPHRRLPRRLLPRAAVKYPSRCASWSLVPAGVMPGRQCNKDFRDRTPAGG